MNSLNYCFDIFSEERTYRKFFSSNELDDMYNFIIKNYNLILKEDGLIPLHYEILCDESEGYYFYEYVIKTDIISLRENLTKIFVELNTGRIDLWVKSSLYDKLSKWTKI